MNNGSSEVCKTIKLFLSDFFCPISTQQTSSRVADISLTKVYYGLILDGKKTRLKKTSGARWAYKFTANIALCVFLDMAIFYQELVL